MQEGLSTFERSPQVMVRPRHVFRDSFSNLARLKRSSQVKASDVMNVLLWVGEVKLFYFLRFFSAERREPCKRVLSLRSCTGPVPEPRFVCRQHAMHQTLPLFSGWVWISRPPLKPAMH